MSVYLSIIYYELIFWKYKNGLNQLKVVIIILYIERDEVLEHFENQGPLPQEVYLHLLLPRDAPTPPLFLTS